MPASAYLGLSVGALENVLDPRFLPHRLRPATVVAFSIGTSWTTMALLLPTMLPVAYQMGSNAGRPGAAAVLDGAIFGDHCRPLAIRRFCPVLQHRAITSARANAGPLRDYNDVHSGRLRLFGQHIALLRIGIGYACRRSNARPVDAIPIDRRRPTENTNPALAGQESWLMCCDQSALQLPYRALARRPDRALRVGQAPHHTLPILNRIKSKAPLRRASEPIDHARLAESDTALSVRQRYR